MRKGASVVSSLPFNLSARAAEALMVAATGGIVGGMQGSRLRKDLDAEIEWRGKDDKTYRRPRTAQEKKRQRRSIAKGILLGSALGAAVSPLASRGVRNVRSLMDEQKALLGIDDLLSPAKKMNETLKASMSQYRGPLPARDKSALKRMQRQSKGLEELMAADKKQLYGLLAKAEEGREAAFWGSPGKNPLATWQGHADRLASRVGFKEHDYMRRLSFMEKKAYYEEIEKISSHHGG